MKWCTYNLQESINLNIAWENFMFLMFKIKCLKKLKKEEMKEVNENNIGFFYNLTNRWVIKIDLNK